MAFCEKCGTKNEEGARFCSECGSYMGNISEQKTENKPLLKKELSKEEDFTIEDFADAIKDVGRVVNKEKSIQFGRKKYKIKPIKFILSIVWAIILILIWQTWSSNNVRKDAEQAAIEAVFSTAVPGYTCSFGDVVQNFLTDSKWKSEETDNNEHLVTATGYESELGEVVKMTFTFSVTSEQVSLVQIKNEKTGYSMASSDNDMSIAWRYILSQYGY